MEVLGIGGVAGDEQHAGRPLYLHERGGLVVLHANVDLGLDLGAVALEALARGGEREAHRVSAGLEVDGLLAEERVVAEDAQARPLGHSALDCGRELERLAVAHAGGCLDAGDQGLVAAGAGGVDDVEAHVAAGGDAGGRGGAAAILAAVAQQHEALAGVGGEERDAELDRLLDIGAGGHGHGGNLAERRFARRRAVDEGVGAEGHHGGLVALAHGAQRCLHERFGAPARRRGNRVRELSTRNTVVRSSTPRTICVPARLSTRAAMIPERRVRLAQKRCGERRRGKASASAHSGASRSKSRSTEGKMNESRGISVMARKWRVVTKTAWERRGFPRCPRHCTLTGGRAPRKIRTPGKASLGRG